MVREFSASFTLFLVGSDAVIVLLSLRLAEALRFAISLGLEGPDVAWVTPGPLYGFALLIWLSLFITFGVYNPRRVSHLMDEIRILLAGNALAMLVFAGTLYFSFRNYSRLQSVYFAVLVTSLTVGHRVAVRVFFRLRGGRTYDSRNVVIVGTGKAARRTAEMIANYAWTGLYLVGHVSDPEEPRTGDDDAGRLALNAPLLGAIDDLASLIQEHHVDEVVIALPLLAQGRLIDLVRTLEPLSVNIRVVPDYSDLAFLHTTVEDFSGMPLIGLREPALTDLQRFTKRLFDLALAALLLIPALPLMALIALAIRLDSPGPVIYRQERVGERKRPLMIYKFRTMVVGADQTPPEAVAIRDETGCLIYKHADDPRVTRVGRWLRRTSLDELPQLFNVLRGNMSLVGPRPEMPWLVEKYEPWQHKRFEVPQGMTGWWQISGRADRPMYLYTEEDLFYIRNYSLLLDIQILFRTIGVVLSGRGAY